VENKRLIALRKKAGLTQEQLADRIGISQSMIAYCELGTRDPGKLNKIKIAKYFNVTVDYLFYEVYYD
jgi:putative transcriptional regulator